MECRKNTAGAAFSNVFVMQRSLLEQRVRTLNSFEAHPNNDFWLPGTADTDFERKAPVRCFRMLPEGWIARAPSIINKRMPIGQRLFNSCGCIREQQTTAVRRVMLCWSRLCIFFALAFLPSLSTARLMSIHLLQVESNKSGWLAGCWLAG